LSQLVFSYLYARFGMEVHVPASLPRDVGNISNPLGRDNTNRLFFLKFKISLIFPSSFLYMYSRCITVLFDDNPISFNSKKKEHIHTRFPKNVESLLKYTGQLRRSNTRAAARRELN